MRTLATVRRGALCGALVAAALVAAALVPATARADGGLPFDLHLQLEPGIAFPFTNPQASDYSVGGGASIRPGIGIPPTKGWLDVQLAVDILGLSGQRGQGADVFGIGAGVRVKRPHQDGTISPWGEVDVTYVNTGGLSRLGVDAAIGVAFALPIDLGLGERTLWIGPYVRYMYVASFAGDASATPGANLLVIGAAIEIGYPSPIEKVGDKDGDGVDDKHDQCPDQPGPAANFGCPERDTDGDGVPDSKDRCPSQAGPASNGGCPEQKRVQVTEKKIEVGEKVFFETDKAVILERSFNLLDEVVQVLKDHPNIRIRVDGHTDARGSAQHNMELSDARARSVMEYFIAHGIPAERLDSKGFGATQPLDTNDTPEGREKNRRVEFTIIE